MLSIINLTPHTIKLNNCFREKEFTPSGMVARVSAQFSLTTSPELLKEEIYIYTVEYGEIEGLPEPEEGKLLLS